MKILKKLLARILVSFFLFFTLWYFLGDFKYKKNDSEFVLEAFNYSKNLESKSPDKDISAFINKKVKFNTVNEFAEFMEKNNINYIVRADDKRINIIGKYYYYRKSEIFGTHVFYISASFEGNKIINLRGSVFFESI